MNTQNYIAQSAIRRSVNFGFDYAFNGAPSSPLVGLSGNKRPGETQVRWLKDRNKCNQFVGDVLTNSGFVMPTFTMIDGTLHYMNAERLPGQSRHFDKRLSLDSVEKGDVIVIDKQSRRGENGAHTEIVTSVDTLTQTMSLTGARKKGAFERDFSSVFMHLKETSEAGVFLHPFEDSKVYFLRPKMRN